MTPLGITPKRIASSLKLGSGMVYERAKHKNSLSADTMLKVEQFYLRNDNTRMSSGKKQTITRKKVKKQKQFLMRNLYEKFKSEQPAHQISYATFAKLRPFWVVKPTPKDRDTCLCQAHETGQLLADRLYFLGLVDMKHRHIEDLAVS